MEKSWNLNLFMGGIALYSPWGAIQYTEDFAPGFSFVSTASHGGYRLSPKFAKKRLSDAALKRATYCREYYYYEEDCDWAIPVWELPEYWSLIFAGVSNKIKDDPRQYLLEILSAWSADYLLEIGVEPAPEQYQFYLARRLEEEMRQERHPDLIVCARGSWFTKRPGVVSVITADGREHLVTEASYDEVYRAGRPILLSRCVGIS